MTKVLNILTALLKTIQLILVFLLSLILWVVQINNSDFKCRWSFESCNFKETFPEGEESVLETLKKIWSLKTA